ncbi:MAG: MFS transporter [Clostridia bacterium]|nr:MFS transporter [Clostridia bacterium]
MKRPNYQFSRVMYLLEAALEYFISLLVTGAYLAKIAGPEGVGLSDGTVGILSAFISLGCGFQIFALLLRNKTPVKRWVTVLHILNQGFFALVWFTPLFSLSATAKSALFIAFLLLGHVVNNLVNPAKTNWFMSLVDDHKRGVFTANKEIISLLSGFVVTFLLALVYDGLESAGKTTEALIVGGVSLTVLMILHTLTLVLSDEKPVEKTEGSSLKALLADRKQTKVLFSVIGINVFWNMAHFISTPFFGSYQVNELGFSMTFVMTVLGLLYALVRAAFSRFFGKFADRYSFVSMLNICFAVAAVAFFVNAFTVPENGKVFFTVYYTLYAVSMAGINSAAINLIYDYVEEEHRTVALAFSQSISGIVGFLTATCGGVLVSWIQSEGFVLFGRNLYAQQVMSFLGFLGVLLTILYMNLVVRKLPKRNK